MKRPFLIILYWAVTLVLISFIISGLHETRLGAIWKALIAGSSFALAIWVHTFLFFVSPQEKQKPVVGETSQASTDGIDVGQLGNMPQTAEGSPQDIAELESGMEPDEPDRGWFWERAFILLVACSGAVVGLNVFLKGTVIISNPSGVGEAVGSSLAVWALGGIAPAIAYIAKKSPRKTLLKTWIVGCCVAFALITFVQAYVPLNAKLSSIIGAEVDLEGNTDNGGYIYCNKIISLPKEMGPPEAWSEGKRQELISDLIRDDFAIHDDVDVVPLFAISKANLEGKYIFPCATLFSYEGFQKYADERKANQRQRNTINIKKRANKRMECLYEHRKEINEQNKAAIQYICNQRAK